MIDYSLGEIDSLVLKAFRGSGFSWGMAQEAGAAAAWLALHDLPALDSFAKLLARTDGVPHAELIPQQNNSSTGVSAVSEVDCPVVAGTAMADGLIVTDTVAAPIELKQVLVPLILFPFIAQCAERRQIWLDLTVNGQKVDGRPETAAGIADLAVADVVVSRASKPYNIASGHSRRGTGSAASMQALERLAHRTYVPASDASRLAGAGAGLLDND